MIDKKIYWLCIFIVGLAILVEACRSKREGPPIKEVTIENQSGYVFKKIYVVDKHGFTHEILTATSGNKNGGVSLLELCVYKE